MMPAEAAELLGYCAAYDRRTLSKIDAQAWAAALPDITLDDARQAVVEHYATETSWIMPAHIRERVKAMRKARLDRDAAPTPPAELTDDPAACQRWIRDQNQRIASGKTVASAIGAPERDLDPETATRGAAAVRAALHTTRTDAIDWCGECHEGTRLIDTDDGRAARCPRCHPNAHQEIS